MVILLVFEKYFSILQQNKEKLEVVAGVIAKCLYNVTEFTKAFNVMLGLHNQLENTLKILEDGDQIINSESRPIGATLSEHFTTINKLMGDLKTSKKTQFLKEANEYHRAKLSRYYK